MPLTVLTPMKYFKNYRDPTSTHIPFVGNNKEAILLRHVEQFRFVDRKAFDFRGETEHNLHDKGGTLANSNQRTRKGFEPTFTLKRDFGGLVGSYKLDWILVKPLIPRPRGEGMSYEFAPHFPVTMRDLNNAVPDGISDHAPITVDLPLTDPAAVKAGTGLITSIFCLGFPNRNSKSRRRSVYIRSELREGGDSSRGARATDISPVRQALPAYRSG